MNKEQITKLARKHGTSYTNRHIPGEPAFAFGNESWGAFCDALVAVQITSKTGEQVDSDKVREKVCKLAFRYRKSVSHNETEKAFDDLLDYVEEVVLSQQKSKVADSDVIKALNEQPIQPVAEVTGGMESSPVIRGLKFLTKDCDKIAVGTKLYTAAPQSLAQPVGAQKVVLTDGEVLQLIHCTPRERDHYLKFARSIEQAHGIKESE